MKLQTVAFDASTLILMAKVDLLQIVAGKVEIHIPRVVENEALAKPELYDAQLIARMIKEGAIRVSEVGASVDLKTIQKQFRLAEGESAALWMAKDNQCALAIDDGPGIRAAKIMGIPFVTAIQVLVGLSEEGHIDKPSAIAKLDSLAVWGRYSAQLVGDAHLKISATTARRIRQRSSGGEKGGD